MTNDNAAKVVKINILASHLGLNAPGQPIFGTLTPLAVDVEAEDFAEVKMRLNRDGYIEGRTPEGIASIFYKAWLLGICEREATTTVVPVKKSIILPGQVN